MSGSVSKLAVAFALLFALSVGAGYGVGAQVRTPDDLAAPAGTSTSLTTIAPTTVAPTTTEAPTTAAPTTVPPTTAAPTTTTTTTPGPRVPDREHPLRVALAGDSVMAGLSPAIKAGLETDGTAIVKFVLTPSVLRDPAVRYTWNTQLNEFDPEVIVMFVGTWEAGVVTKGTDPTSDPNFRASYERDVLDPWVQLITSRGASVIWIGNPTVRSDAANALFTQLNAAFKDLPDRWRQVQYLDANPPLNGSQPGYHDVVVLADGTKVRTRQTDGLHLCAGGAALLGNVLLQHVHDAFNAPVHDGWEQGSWRGESVYPPEACPAPT